MAKGKIKQCPTCEVDVFAYRNKRYCSTECQKESRLEKQRKSVVKTCKICPRTFTNHKCGIQVYCDLCREQGKVKASIRDTYREKYPTLSGTCSWCNRYFILSRKDQLYCRHKCTSYAYRARKTKSKPIKGGKCKICNANTKLKRHHSCNWCSKGKTPMKRGNELWND